MVPSDALLKRYDRPGPRYTSYPTALEFHPGFASEDYDRHLGALGSEQCVSLYLHLPFCRERCAFCGCHVIATKKAEVAERYLEYLEKEMDLLLERVGRRPAVIQYHWGGGTPTYLTPAQIERLDGAVRRRFDLLPDAERSIEIDPRVTTPEHIDTLRNLGFNRLSMGVQDFTPQVQEAIGRGQSEEETRALYEYSRAQGFESINIDLVYGLPAQTAEGFAANLAAVLMLRPERVALYSYAHVPWVRGNQKKIDVSLLPESGLKLEFMQQAVRAFGASGYERIGMDHFALPEDALSAARRHRRLHRNFMGYTTHPTPNLLGLGVSAIGEVGGAYAQNTKKLSTYYAALDAGRLPVERGYVLTRDDRIRRQVIMGLMCNLHIDTRAVQRAFGLRFDRYFADELAELRGGFSADGLVNLADGAIAVTPQGAPFVRNICMVFDRNLAKKQQEAKPAFSRTV